MMVLMFEVPRKVGTRRTTVYRPWSTNRAGQMHWATRREFHGAWRDTTAAAVLALYPRHRNTAPGTVTVDIPFERNARRDPHNYVGTVCKAIVDGLVQAGVWPDDTTEYVTVNEPRLVVTDGPVVVHIEERAA